MKKIKEIMMERDKLTELEADELIQEAAEEFQQAVSNNDYEWATDIMADYFALEPDYMMDMFQYLK